MKNSKKVKKMISTKATACLNNLKNDNTVARSQKLTSVGEYGYALLIRWNVLEQLLKLHKYYHKIKDDWPDTLNFINANWGTLKRLKEEQEESYNLLFDNRTGIRCLRNRIAHTNIVVSSNDYHKYIEHLNWAISRLKSNMPNVDSLIRRKQNSNNQMNK